MHRLLRHPRARGRRAEFHFVRCCKVEEEQPAEEESEMNGKSFIADVCFGRRVLVGSAPLHLGRKRSQRRHVHVAAHISWTCAGLPSFPVRLVGWLGVRFSQSSSSAEW